MAIIVGADGCRSGWIALILDTDTRRIGSKIFPTASELAHHLRDVSLIAIDIPVGLADDGPRRCDLAARKFLGPKRGSSVFPAPIRPVIARLRISRDAAMDASGAQSPSQRLTYSDACDLNESITGKRISKQAWHIYPKILEIDDLVTSSSDVANKVIEVHPEVSFAAWAGDPILERKKKREGFERRRTLVQTAFGPAAYESVRNRYLRREVANDDILDAFAAVWSAERALNGTGKRLPDSPPSDARGLPMQIVY